MSQPSIAITLLAFLPLWLAPNLAHSQDNGGNPPIITFNQSHNLGGDSDLNMVEVFSDGSVLINRLPGNRNPGVFKRQLSDQELAELINLAEASGIETANNATLTSISSESGVFVDISDPTSTVMEFTRASDSRRLVDAQSEEANVETLSIQNLSSLSSDIPGIDPLKELQIRLINIFTESGR